MIDFGEHLPQKKFLDLTPMIDVVFLLLIFFMLTSIFAKPMLPLALPEAASGEIQEEAPVLVSLSEDGKVFLDGKETVMSQLEQELKQVFATKNKKEFSLQADKGVAFGRVVTVMDKARLAGAEAIAVMTEDKE